MYQPLDSVLARFFLCYRAVGTGVRITYSRKLEDKGFLGAGWGGIDFFLQNPFLMNDSFVGRGWGGGSVNRKVILLDNFPQSPSKVRKRREMLAEDNTSPQIENSNKK